MIMVTGTAGALGSSILAALRARGLDPIAANRTGTNARRIDFDDPASIDLRGASTMVMVSAGAAEDDVVTRRHSAVIDAAVRDGVRHIVYTSLVGAGDHLAFALAHRVTERLIADCGLRWTVLRNGLYAELIGGLLTWAGETIISPFGVGAVAAVARADLADAAAIVSAAPDGHIGRTYELAAGPITADGIAAHLGVAHHVVGLADYRAALAAAPGLAPFQPPMLASIATSIRHGLLAEPGGDLRTILGRAPDDPLEIAARAALATRPPS